MTEITGSSKELGTRDWRAGCECNRAGLCFRCQAAERIERLELEVYALTNANKSLADRDAGQPPNRHTGHEPPAAPRCNCKVAPGMAAFHQDDCNVMATLPPGAGPVFLVHRDTERQRDMFWSCDVGRFTYYEERASKFESESDARIFSKYAAIGGEPRSALTKCEGKS